jgi:hypothetical protein
MSRKERDTETLSLEKTIKTPSAHAYNELYSDTEVSSEFYYVTDKDDYP